MGGRYHYYMLSRVSRCSASAVLGAALGVALPATAGWGRLPWLQPAASCGASPAAADELALTAGSAATHVRAMVSAAWSATGGAGDGGSWDDPCDINALRTVEQLLDREKDVTNLQRFVLWNYSTPCTSYCDQRAVTPRRFLTDLSCLIRAKRGESLLTRVTRRLWLEGPERRTVRSCVHPLLP